MAYILHIDTATDNSLVALSRNGQLLSAIENNGQRNHASFINNHIDEVLKAAGIGLPQLSAIALCGGPGSYTGLRIGVSAAKGLALSIDARLIGIPTLEALAASTAAIAQPGDVICATLNARRDEVYAAAFEVAEGTLLSTAEAAARPA